MFLRLWRDEKGVVNSMDLILITTILVIGMIVGLVCLRNQVVQELSDTAGAIGSLNQSYSYNARTLNWGTYVMSVAGSSYTDQPNVDSTIDGSNFTAPAIRNAVPGEN